MGFLGVITLVGFVCVLLLMEYRVQFGQDPRANHPFESIVTWVMLAVIAVNGLWVIDTYVVDIPNPFGPAQHVPKN